MQRRHMLYSGAALAAGLAGAGVAWWRTRPQPLATGAGAPADPLWGLTLETPDGAPLALASFVGQPLLINFWATWCPPCVQELPLLDSFAQAQRARGWRVLGLAVDQPSAVRAWLQKSPLGFPVAMAGLGGTELSKRLGNASGSLPFSVAFDASGQVLQRKIGQLSPDDLTRWAALAPAPR